MNTQRLAEDIVTTLNLTAKRRPRLSTHEIVEVIRSLLDGALDHEEDLREDYAAARDDRTVD